MIRFPLLEHAISTPAHFSTTLLQYHVISILGASAKSSLPSRARVVMYYVVIVATMRASGFSVFGGQVVEN